MTSTTKLIDQPAPLGPFRPRPAFSPGAFAHRGQHQLRTLTADTKPLKAFAKWATRLDAAKLNEAAWDELKDVRDELTALLKDRKRYLGQREERRAEAERRNQPTGGELRSRQKAVESALRQQVAQRVSQELTAGQAPECGMRRLPAEHPQVHARRIREAIRARLWAEGVAHLRSLDAWDEATHAEINRTEPRPRQPRSNRAGRPSRQQKEWTELKNRAAAGTDAPLMEGDGA